MWIQQKRSLAAWRVCFTPPNTFGRAWEEGFLSSVQAEKGIWQPQWTTEEFKKGWYDLLGKPTSLAKSFVLYIERSKNVRPHRHCPSKVNKIKLSFVLIGVKKNVQFRSSSPFTAKWEMNGYSWLKKCRYRYSIFYMHVSTCHVHL
jgi:hypothetical protein